MEFKEKFQSYKDRIIPLVDTMKDATEEATKKRFYNAIYIFTWL